MKIRLAAIFAGRIDTQPVVELISHTEAKGRGAVKTHPSRLGGRRDNALIDALEILVGHTDVAAQVPSAEIFDRRRIILLRLHDGHVRGKRHRRQQ